MQLVLSCVQCVRVRDVDPRLGQCVCRARAKLLTRVEGAREGSRNGNSRPDLSSAALCWVCCVAGQRQWRRVTSLGKPTVQPDWWPFVTAAPGLSLHFDARFISSAERSRS